MNVANGSGKIVFVPLIRKAQNSSVRIGISKESSKDRSCPNGPGRVTVIGWLLLNLCALIFGVLLKKIVTRSISDRMPKAEKERPKHATSLAAQLQNDRNPLVSQSKRAKWKRNVQEQEERDEEGEQVVSGKLGRQILTMAREQQEALEEDEEAGSEEGEEDTMKWRDSQM